MSRDWANDECSFVVRYKSSIYACGRDFPRLGKISLNLRVIGLDYEIENAASIYLFLLMTGTGR
jgi:hypothetical protein